MISDVCAQRGDRMDDLISRQAAIMHFVKASKNYECEMFDLREVTHELWQLPSAQPEQKWIPCSERLPEVYYDYLGNHSSEEVILLMNDEEYIKISNGHFNPVGVFEVYEKDGPAFVGKPVRDVIAWMPLPEPYRGEA